MSNETKQQLNINLMNVRLSFPALFKPSSITQADGSASKPKFQATFLLDKKAHAKEIAELNKLIQRAQIDKFTKVVKLKNCCLKDGDEKEETAGYGPEVMSIIAKSDNKPTVVTRKKEIIYSKDDGRPYVVVANAGEPDEDRNYQHKDIPFGGCYVNAGITIFAYKHAVGGMGVSASLRWVQFAKDGEAFGAGRVDMDEIPEVAADDASNY